jgi:hypothetical protein
MSVQRRIVLGVVGWLALATILHLWLNLHAFDFAARSKDSGREQFRVGYLPVT